MLAAYYMLMRGTPFIYQGQEIGMTNCPFESIEEYRDVDALNLFRIETKLESNNAGIMNYLAKRGRDHARTPMQWNAEAMAGFTTGEPWIKVNPNYTFINVEQSLKDENSVLNFYKKLIRLRRENKALIYGDFMEIYKDSNSIGGFVRAFENENWTVLCNFTEDTIPIPEIEDGFVVLTNVNAHEKGILKPFEALICKSSRE